MQFNITRPFRSVLIENRRHLCVESAQLLSQILIFLGVVLLLHFATDELLRVAAQKLSDATLLCVELLELGNLIKRAEKNQSQRARVADRGI